MKPGCPETLQTKKRPPSYLGIMPAKYRQTDTYSRFLMKIAAHRFMKKPRRRISRQSIIKICRWTL